MSSSLSEVAFFQEWTFKVPLLSIFSCSEDALFPDLELGLVLHYASSHRLTSIVQLEEHEMD